MIEFLTRVGEHVGVWLYVITGVLALGEAAALLGLVVPGETALLVAGFYCRQGVLNLPVTITAAVAGAIVGDSLGYELGRRFGPPLRRSRMGGWIGMDRWDRTEAFVRRHGGSAVLLGRFTALLRALVPAMAGMSRMPYLPVFLPWNVFGGVVWGAGVVLLGYGFAASLDTVEKYLTWGPVPVFVAIAAVLVFLRLRRRRREREENRAGGDDERSARTGRRTGRDDQRR